MVNMNEIVAMILATILLCAVIGACIYMKIRILDSADACVQSARPAIECVAIYR